MQEILPISFPMLGLIQVVWRFYIGLLIMRIIDHLRKEIFIRKVYALTNTRFLSVMDASKARRKSPIGI
jgi:hypothetical protein